MNVAAISITYNDDYKFNEWVEHYQLYKDELYLHIIIDNSSNPLYLNKVEETFCNSIIIKRKTNGGCTIAYNDGIRYALQDKSVDSIMLIGNDIRIEKGGVKKLHDFLYTNEKYGMVAPLMFIKDSDLIENFGSDITHLLMMKSRFHKKREIDIVKRRETVSAVMGGMNLAKREFYEQVGLQDENLFMYSDEVDMGLRSQKNGFQMAVTADVHSWHQHINPQQRTRRFPFSSYLIGRNKIYLARKHKGFLGVATQFFYHLYLFTIGWLLSLSDKEGRIDREFFLKGSVSGLKNNMSINHIIKDL